MAGPTPAAGAVGYVVSRYPAYSHAFIQTEVEALTELGWTVRAFTLNPPDFEAGGPGGVVVVKAQPPRLLLRAVARAALLSPGALLGAGRTALASGLRRRRRLKGALWGLAHLVEALVVFDAARRSAVPHLHAHFANSGADVARLAARFGRLAAARGIDHAGPRSWSLTVHGPSDFTDAPDSDLAGKVRSARDVVCISDFARATLVGLVPDLPPGRLRVIRMGVHLPPPPGPSEAADPPARILFVGRMVQEKAPDVLLDALERLGAAQDGGAAVRATFVGAGPLLEPLRERAGRAATAASFRGALRHDDVLRLYGEHDVFCLPSFSEGLPVVLMEAMSRGIAVVTTPVAAIPELVRDGETGLLVPPGDADALARAVQRLAADPRLRADLAGRGREAVERLHDTRRSVRALAEVFGAAP